METHLSTSVRRHLTQLLQEKAQVIGKLTEQKQTMMAGRQQLTDMITQIEREEETTDGHIAALQKHIAALKESVSEMESEEAIDVDKAIKTTAPLYRQILELVADDGTLEDTIYQLGKALHAGELSLDLYLRHVRRLSEKQFRTRALIIKARSKAGLST